MQRPRDDEGAQSDATDEADEERASQRRRTAPPAPPVADEPDAYGGSADTSAFPDNPYADEDEDFSMSQTRFSQRSNIAS